MSAERLVVLATHPVQYHAPIYHHLQQQLSLPVTVIYGSDFSVAGYRDPEFGAAFKWDGDLLSGYTSHFLEQVATGGAATTDAVQGRGLDEALTAASPSAILLTGYQGAFHRRAWAAALRHKKPLLFRAETTDHALTRSPLKQWGRDMVLRWLYRQCAVLLPIGSNATRHYNRLAPTKPQVLSPYAVDTSPFELGEAAREKLRPATRTALSVTNEQIVILMSGKLIPKKNPLLLMAALKQMPPALRERMVVLFVGDGELRPALENAATESPQITLKFVGFQNQRALSPYYHAADLLVLPSAFGETWGLVVNEALHHGLPVVVSDQVGSAVDLVQTGVTGAVFPSGDADALRAALEQTLPLVGQSSTRTATTALIANYTVERAAEGIATALRRATQPHKERV
jgi:glycosyltransferase involved in cell wall biosynthesis